MEAKQIQLLKDTHMQEVEREDGSKTTLGGYMRFCLDGGIDFITSKDLVVFDDTNNMLHCVAINEDGRSQADYPVKVISSDYGVVQQVECIYSQKDFEKALKDGFLKDIVSEEKINAMINWSRKIQNQAIQPSRPTPYYDTNPIIIPMANSTMPRIDKVLDSNTNEDEETTETTTEEENVIDTPTESDEVIDSNTDGDEETTEGVEGEE